MGSLGAFALILVLFGVHLDFVRGLNTDELQDLQTRYSSYTNENGTIGVKGLSIGGWLVTEPFITPSLYQRAFNIVSELGNNTTDIVDEYTLTKVLGYDTARNLLDQHFDSWISEDDIKQISEDGFNLIRIPIGYWAWKQDNVTNMYIGNITFEDPYVSDGLQLKYLDRALNWAEKYNLNVWIDLHGAPNTQNGFDNSGQRNLYNDLSWLKTESSRQLTLEVWSSLFESYLSQGGESPVAGIEIVNEPLSPKLDDYTMTEYFYKAYQIYLQKQSSNDSTTFVFHDAFKDIGYWNLQFNSKYTNVSDQYTSSDNITFRQSDIMVDHHHYEIFTDFQLNNNQYDRIMDIMNYGDSIHDEESSYHHAIVGEFSAALTDCAIWLNGVGIGSRYDGSYYKTTNFTTDYEPVGECRSQLPIANWTQDYKEHVRQFIEAQLATYDAKTDGWIFWNWKTESAAEWDYLKLKESNLFPSPLDNYTYFQADGDMEPSFSSSLAPVSSTSSFPATTTTSTGSKKKNGAASVRSHFKFLDSPESISLACKTCLLCTFIGLTALWII